MCLLPLPSHLGSADFLWIHSLRLSVTCIPGVNRDRGRDGEKGKEDQCEGTLNLVPRAHVPFGQHQERSYGIINFQSPRFWYFGFTAHACLGFLGVQSFFLSTDEEAAVSKRMEV